MSIDYDLMTRIKSDDTVDSKKAKLELWKKYELAVHKQEHTLQRKIKEHNMKFEVENYVPEAWDAFDKAVNSIKLEKIKNQKTWSFWVCLNGYLMSHNRDIIKHHLKESNNEISLSRFSDEQGHDYSSLVTRDDQSPEMSYLIDEERTAFWNAVKSTEKRLTKRQNKMMIMKANGARRKEVCTTLNIDSKAYYEDMQAIKTTLRANLDSQLNPIGGLNYLK